MIGTDFSIEADGWAVIPGFLDAEELSSVRANLASSLLARAPTCVRQPGNDLLPLRWDDVIVAKILRSKAHVQQIRGALAASDLKWLSGYLSAKAPESPALWRHQDWWCWDHPISFGLAAPQAAVLYYLDDTNERSGALRVLAGSHHATTPIHSELPPPDDVDASGLPADHPAMGNFPGQRTLSVRAGDAVVLDYRLLHGTPRQRRASPPRLHSAVVHPRLDKPSARAQGPSCDALRAARIDEAAAAGACDYADLLPTFAGAASLAINRCPPATFNVRDVHPAT